MLGCCKQCHSSTDVLYADLESPGYMARSSSAILTFYFHFHHLCIRALVFPASLPIYSDVCLDVMIAIVNGVRFESQCGLDLHFPGG